MKTRGLSWLLAIVVFVLVVGLACGGGTPVPPTSAPAPTKAPATNTPEPPPTSDIPFQLSATKYVNPSGAFSLYPPEGWSVDDSNTDAFFQPEDQKGAIYIQVTNTVVELADDAFGSFVGAREFNFFSGYDGYEASDPEYNAAEDAYIASKTLTLNEVPQVVSTIYYQKGSAIYSIDLWADADVAEAYFEIYNGIVLEMDPAPVADMVGYNFIWTFTGPNNLYTLDVPMHWSWSHSEDGGVIIDTFLSPDGNAGVQYIIYDDGTSYTKGQAGQIALALLNRSYTSGAGDIKVTKDTLESDGSETLAWTSLKSGISGFTNFEVRGTTILFLTMLSTDTFADVYNPMLNDILASYRVP